MAKHRGKCKIIELNIGLSLFSFFSRTQRAAHHSIPAERIELQQWRSQGGVGGGGHKSAGVRKKCARKCLAPPVNVCETSLPRCSKLRTDVMSQLMKKSI